MHEKLDTGSGRGTGRGVPFDVLPVNIVVARGRRTQSVHTLLVVCQTGARLLTDTTGGVLVAVGRPRVVVELHTRAVGYSLQVNQQLGRAIVHRPNNHVWSIRVFQYRITSGIPN
jgi:hypothetical protein